jgi:hypothetical protein
MLNNNEAIPPLMLEEARIHAKEVVKDIKVAIGKSSNPFGEPSLVWQYFSPAGDSPQSPTLIPSQRIAMVMAMATSPVPRSSALLMVLTKTLSPVSRARASSNAPNAGSLI